MAKVKKVIPANVKLECDAIVDAFNEKKIGDPNRFYVTSYRGRFLYVGRLRYDEVRPVCRLEYKDSMEDWEFAIYKYSRGGYDPDEIFFPGRDCVDGTVEGALQAGLEAYG